MVILNKTIKQSLPKNTVPKVKVGLARSSVKVVLIFINKITPINIRFSQDIASLKICSYLGGNLKKIKIFYLVLCLFLPTVSFGDSDPFTKAGSQMSQILFGTLGTSLCALIIGATFLMAKVGKISWDKFIQVGLCTAGFLGAPSIVALVKSWVG